MQWTIRLMHENLTCPKSYFVTLTYNDEHLPKDGQLKKKHLQDYFKRLRKTEKFKYYAVGEYGTEGNRPHYHALIFGANADKIVDKWSDDNGEIGFVDIGKVQQASIHYVTGYVVNKFVNEIKNKEREFALMSKNLGSDYIEKNKAHHRIRGNYEYLFAGGVKGTLPRYYRERIFNEVERQMIQYDSMQEQLEKAEKGINHIGYFNERNLELSKRKGKKVIAKRHKKRKNL